MILPCRSQVMTVLMWFNERSVLILRVAVMMRYNTNKVLYRLLSLSLLLCIRQHWLPDGCTIISDSFRFSGSDASPFFLSPLSSSGRVMHQMLFSIGAISRSTRYRSSSVSPASTTLPGMLLNISSLFSPSALGASTA